VLQDNTSMLNVPYWADSTTEVFSLTLVSGPCSIPYEDALAYQSTMQQAPVIPGCNMRSVDNKTLVQTLLRDATNVSTVPLLIRVVSNTTLGVGITHSIPIRRPIVLLGMVSSPTSIDMGMVVNQLNVTLPHGKITWQSVILENLAPGVCVCVLTSMQHVIVLTRLHASKALRTVMVADVKTALACQLHACFQVFLLFNQRRLTCICAGACAQVTLFRQ
jgi:hypothetical protein